MCEVKFEIYRFMLRSNVFWFKKKSITNRYIKKKPKYVSIPLFWLPPRAIKRTKLVSTIHTAHVSGVNIWNSWLYNIHILPIMNAGNRSGGLIRRNISWKKSNISLVVPLSKNKLTALSPIAISPNLSLCFAQGGKSLRLQRTIPHAYVFWAKRWSRSLVLVKKLSKKMGL